MRRLSITFLLLLHIPLTALNAVELSPAARQSFSRYVQLFETYWKQGNMDGDKAQARNGHLVIWQHATAGRDTKPSGAMIQDWSGLMFLPGTDIQQVRSMMQDYQNYKIYFKPEVTESKLIRRQGDDFEVFLRLYKRHVLSVVLNTSYSIRYASVDSRHMSIVSRSTRVAEVKDAGQRSEAEEPPGLDSGYLWALNSYWRFEEADGGVYAECKAISLSRDVPFGLGWAIKGFVDRFPKESMQNTLAGVRRAVLERPR